MTKENQEKQNGRTEGGSGKNANRRNNDRRKNNTSFKRVNLERKRPQLSRGETAAAKEVPSGSRKPRRGSKAGKDPNAKLKIIPLGGLDAIGKNMTAFECNGDMI